MLVVEAHSFVSRPAPTDFDAETEVVLPARLRLLEELVKMRAIFVSGVALREEPWPQFGLDFLAAVLGYWGRRTRSMSATHRRKYSAAPTRPSILQRRSEGAPKKLMCRFGVACHAG